VAAFIIADFFADDVKCITGLFLADRTTRSRYWYSVAFVAVVVCRL